MLANQEDQTNGFSIRFLQLFDRSATALAAHFNTLGIMLLQPLCNGPVATGYTRFVVTASVLDAALYKRQPGWVDVAIGSRLDAEISAEISADEADTATPLPCRYRLVDAPTSGDGGAVGALHALTLTVPAVDDRPPARLLLLGTGPAAETFAAAADVPPLPAVLAGLGVALAYERELAICYQRLYQDRFDATHDVLTGLHNRRGWSQVATAEEERCRRYGATAGIVVIDLDGLKQINDSDGHAAGDRLLRRCADTLRARVRANDVVARLGGDEFAILLIDADYAECLASTLRIQRGLDAAGIAASVGFATRPALGSLHDAISAADAAMYECKRQRHRFGVPLRAPLSGTNVVRLS